MQQKEPIAYLAPQAFFFVRKDVEALSAERIVHLHLFHASRPKDVPIAWLHQFRFLLRMRRQGVKQVLAHFAGYHTLLPVLLGFRTHIIIAGADACSFPGINYGSFRKPLMRTVIAFCMRRATTLLPVHRSLVSFTNTYSDSGPIQQGFQHFVPKLKTRWEEIPYGFSTSHWTIAANPPRSGALCIAFGAKPGSDVHFRKGLDLILEAAQALPGIRFTIVGAADPGAYAPLPGNVALLGIIPPNELRELMARHEFYLQPSMMEGFPNALCEAMLMGCIPVVSKMTSMPDIVGDTGMVIARRDPLLLVRALTELSKLNAEEQAKRSARARQRILPFTIESRVAALSRILDA